jgi:hypothetical protein
MQQWVYFDVHKGIGPNKRSVICQKMFGKKCPVCDAQYEILQGGSYKDADPETQKVFKSFYPKNRVMCNIMVDGELKVFESSTFKFSDPLKRAAKSYQESEALERFSFSSPTTGYTITLQTAKKDNPFKPGEAFYDIESVGFRERKVQYSKDIVEDMPKLDTLLHPTDNAEIEGILYGATESGDEVVEEAPVVQEKPKTTVQPPIEAKQSAVKPVEAPVATVTPTIKCIGGGTFGVDYDKFKACDSCAVLTGCHRNNRQVGAEKAGVFEDEIPF